jgi:hypothetical protein
VGLTNISIFGDQSLNQMASSTNLGTKVGGIAGRGIVNAGTTSAVYGVDFKDAFINSVVADVAANVAQGIGDKWGSRYELDSDGRPIVGTKTTDWFTGASELAPVLNPNYSPVMQTFAHAGLGAVAAWATGNDPASGAIGGAVESILGNVLPFNPAHLNTEKVRWGDAFYTGMAALTAGVIAEASGHDPYTAIGAAQNAALNNRMLHPDEIKFMHDEKRVARFITEYEQSTGRTLSTEEAIKLLDRSSARMLDASWEDLYQQKDIARDSFTEAFLRKESSGLYYLDNQGRRHDMFVATPEEYWNPTINLREFSSWSIINDPDIALFRENNRHRLPVFEAAAQRNAGRQMGVLDAAEKPFTEYVSDFVMGLVQLIPAYASTSNTVGPWDSLQLSSDYVALLELQGRYFDSGRFSSYSHETQHRMLVGTMFGGLALGGVVGGVRAAAGVPKPILGMGELYPLGANGGRWSAGQSVVGGSEFALENAGNVGYTFRWVPANAGSQVAKGGTGVAGETGQLFRNLEPTGSISHPRLFPASEIQRTAYNGRVNYVVTESGELILGKSGHISLSQGADVLAAGEVKFVNGIPKFINNASGHYKPSGISAQNAAEAAFGRAGFDAIGKYIEKGF